MFYVLQFIKEYYDLVTDPYQLKNKYLYAEEKEIAALEKYLNELKKCKGLSCKRPLLHC